ncbi:LLM class flavin-dependent oxidoreductase [Dactylosporangium vinaceum]|uniref:LLM class flavin-dependent oxidoreductase n=1 Tax=Dactylosporangium vinaceum TaxID=53362 RepID=A0ABV5M2X2_9ACTN|nr:LLM class flavin-dependent oxidoreductase [Dactylosporangium vinaceum]UAB99853.1 LLM class flavin-dependent oxidoreductase [Dactylosporangium vinaceum]
MSAKLHLAVALDDAVSDPDVWRRADARPSTLFTPAYWLSLVREAERGRLDFVTIADGGTVTGHADRVQGRLAALLIAARIAPVTTGIGLVPVVGVATTEPFHISTQLATLDYLSHGRAGWLAATAGSPEVAADHVETVRRLWDSWDDNTAIRDDSTGRFVNLDKRHDIGFTGRHSSVRGPSTTPRPPQGRPLVAALASGPAVAADLVFVPAGAPRPAGTGAKVFADVAVSFAAETPLEIADRLLDERAGVDGFRLHPAELPVDLTAIVDELLPILRERGAFRHEYTHTTLRGHLGLDRPASRYATTGA